jgi:hypothetical protein
MRSLLAYSLALAICCSSCGTLDQGNINQITVATDPPGDGALHLSSPGFWVPKAAGSYAVSRYGGAGLPGVVAVTDRSILFMQWVEPKKQFVVIDRVPLDAIEDVTRTPYNVVVKQKDDSYDTFGLDALGAHHPRPRGHLPTSSKLVGALFATTRHSR